MLFSCHLHVSSRLLSKVGLGRPSVCHCGSPKWTGHPNVAPSGEKQRVLQGRKCLPHGTILGEYCYKVMVTISRNSQLLLKGVAPKHSSPSATSNFQQLFSASFIALLDHDPQEEGDPAENLSQKRKTKAWVCHAGKMTAADMTRQNFETTGHYVCLHRHESSVQVISPVLHGHRKFECC